MKRNKSDNKFLTSSCESDWYGGVSQHQKSH